MTHPPLIGITGLKNAGKTTLAERLIRELSTRGFTVSSIKHAHHTVDIDEPGRDSHRHREAGAREVALATAKRFAIMHELRDAPEPSVFEIAERLAPADLVIVEGFKSQPFPKIEVRREGVTPLGETASGIIAIASDAPVSDGEHIVLPLDDISRIADFIINRFALEAGDARALG